MWRMEGEGKKGWGGASPANVRNPRAENYHTPGIAGTDKSRFREIHASCCTLQLVPCFVLYLVPSLFPSVNFEPLPRTNYAIGFLVIKSSTVTVYPAAAASRPRVSYFRMAMTHVRYSPAIKILSTLDFFKLKVDKIAWQMATNQNSIPDC